MEQQVFAVRTVYDFPVAAHLCAGSVRYTKLVKRAGVEQPQGVCAHCQTVFQYRKPKPSLVRHQPGEGVTHF